MKDFIRLLVLAGLFISQAAPARTELSSTLALEAAYAYETGEWQKQEIVWHPELVARFPAGPRLTALGMARFDAADELDPGEPSQPFRSRPARKAFPGDTTELELREFYLDHYLGSAFLRLGKQQIVWGQADGLRVLDVLNPLSFREFILPDLEHRRIPLWSLMVEVPVASWMAQLVWIPDGTVTESPLPGAAFSLIPDPFTGQGSLAADRPDFLEEGDYGLRLSGFQGGWDLSLNYLYHTVDDPLIRVLPDQRRVEARYNRSHLIGATASRPYGDITVRTELGVETKRRFNVIADSPVVETEELSYVLGLDYSGIDDTLVSYQFFQNYRFQAAGSVETATEQMSLLLRQNLLNNSLTLEVLGIHSLQ